jgi:hypothetical protein
MLALEHYTPTLLTLPASLTSSHWLLEHASVNLATLTTMAYVVTYLLMDPIAGSKAILTSFNTEILFFKSKKNLIRSALFCEGGILAFL